MIPLDVVELAARLRDIERRDRAGKPRARSWQWVADELRRRGKGAYAAGDVARAVAGIPIHLHPRAPLSEEELRRIDRTWRDGWAEEFPGQPYPGMVEAQKQIAAHRRGVR